MKKIFSFLEILIFTTLFIIVLSSKPVKAMDSIRQGPHHKIMKQLTDEQQKEVKMKMKDLRESGASGEEIRTTVHKMFKEYGVELPENSQGIRGERDSRKGRGFIKVTDQLSEEQKAAIQDKVKTLRDNGASREEIHKEVITMLKEFGATIPEEFNRFPGKRGHRPGRGFVPFLDTLTEEQRAAIREKAKSMHEEGATKEEVHEEIQKMFEDFGLNKAESSLDQSAETSGESLSIRTYPNPFNPETNIEYHLRSNALVAIHIYDIQGKLVRSWADNYRQAGTYTIKWVGLNDNKSPVPSGVYFIRISAGNEILNHRIVMMK